MSHRGQMREFGARYGTMVGRLVEIMLWGQGHVMRVAECRAGFYRLSDDHHDIWITDFHTVRPVDEHGDRSGTRPGGEK